MPDAPDLTVVAVDDLGRLQFVDLRTGDRHRLDLALPPIDATRLGVDTMVEVDGDVVMDADDAVVSLDLDRRIVTVVARDHRVVPSTSPTAVWLVDDFGGDASGTATATRFEPNRVGDEQAQPTVRLPATARVVAGTPDGVIVALRGQTTMVSTDGTGRTIASSPVIASDGRRLARVSCTGARCAATIGTVDDPDRVRTPLARTETSGDPVVATGAFSPDGRLLAVVLEPDLTEGPSAGAAEALVIAVADGRVREHIRIRRHRGDTPLAWSADGRWLAVGAGRTILMWSMVRDEVVPLDDIGVATSVRGLLILSRSVRAPPTG
jgi:hypothetical protein